MQIHSIRMVNNRRTPEYNLQLERLQRANSHFTNECVKASFSVLSLTENYLISTKFTRYGIHVVWACARLCMRVCVCVRCSLNNVEIEKLQVYAKHVRWCCCCCCCSWICFDRVKRTKLENNTFEAYQYVYTKMCISRVMLSAALKRHTHTTCMQTTQSKRK